MEKTQAMFAQLLQLIRVLRGEGGCPWDRQQTLSSLKRYLLEEPHELAEAIDENDPEKIQEEIGDALFLLLFAAEVACDLGYFSIDDVLEGIREKMIRRHPHVFGDDQAKDIPAIRENWKLIKEEEKRAHGSASLRDRIPRHLSSCLRAYWAMGKLRETEPGSRRVKEGAAALKSRAAALEQTLGLMGGEETRRQLGRMFLDLIGLCRGLSVNPEQRIEEALAELIGDVEHKAVTCKELGSRNGSTEDETA